jgi:hypothetical protein
MEENMNEILSAIIGALGVIIAALISTVKRKTNSIEQKRNKILLGLVSTAFFVTLVVLGYLILRPLPHARIIQPEDYYDHQTVQPDVKVVVEYKDIPRNRYLWVVVRIPSVRLVTPLRPSRLVYPQLQSGKLPTEVTGTGNLETTVHLGGDKDSGAPFNILVLLLDEESNRSFVDYSLNCINTGACGGIQLPETGEEILDFVTVVRE